MSSAKQTPEQSSRFEVFTGTVQEFLRAGVTINGQQLDTVSFSILARYGLAKIAGCEVKKDPSKRGRCGIIYRLQGKSGFSVNVPNKVEIVASTQQTETSEETDSLESM